MHFIESNNNGYFIVFVLGISYFSVLALRVGPYCCCVDSYNDSVAACLPVCMLPTTPCIVAQALKEKKPLTPPNLASRLCVPVACVCESSICAYQLKVAGSVTLAASLQVKQALVKRYHPTPPSPPIPLSDHIRKQINPFEAVILLRESPLDRQVVFLVLRGAIVNRTKYC